jgi:hypothetical protein
VTRPSSRRLRAAAWTLAALPLALAACSSSPGSGSATPGSTAAGSSAPSASNSSLRGADAKLLTNISDYESKASSCKSASASVVCLEKADVDLGNEVHTYANLLAVGKGFTAPQSDVLAARNDAQTLANSLEILGDAQPTQANYNQVLNTYDLNGAIATLRGAVSKLDGAVGS